MNTWYSVPVPFTLKESSILPRCCECQGIMVPETSAPIPVESGAHVWLQCPSCDLTKEFVTVGNGELKPVTSGWLILMGLVAFVVIGLAYALLRQ